MGLRRKMKMGEEAFDFSAVSDDNHILCDGKKKRETRKKVTDLFSFSYPTFVAYVLSQIQSSLSIHRDDGNKIHSPSF